MTRLLSLFGLMRVSEHEAVKRKLSESEMLCHSLDAERNEQASLIAALRLDALAMRRKRQMDRDRRKGR